MEPDRNPGSPGWTAGAERLQALSARIAACQRCPRLLAYCRQVAQARKPAFRDWDYWGRPLPGFGDPAARLVVIGLAPAAHGGNRTGRMFTGDSSATWLARALHRAGFANQPASDHRGDGLILRDAYVTAAARCAPPENRPSPQELAHCRAYLAEELEILPAQVIVTLGQLAFDAYQKILAGRYAPLPEGGRPRFRHLALYRYEPPWPVLIASYHPSRQNTQTGKLTEAMFDAVFAAARAVLNDGR